MKVLLPFSLLLLALSALGQPGTTSLSLSVSDCRLKRPALPAIDTIRFYKLPEDTLLRTVVTGLEKRFPIELNGMPVADYRVVFTNFYHQRVEQPISLANQAHNTVALCPDRLLEYPHNTLAHLQDKDSLIISYTSQGCFHYASAQIIFCKKGDRILACLHDSEWEVRRKPKNSRPAAKAPVSGYPEVVLRPQDIEAFIRFENELNFARNEFCTTVDTYEWKQKDEVLRKTDGGCTWFGFRFLEGAIFGDRD